jgi:hypothetical protein
MNFFGFFVGRVYTTMVKQESGYITRGHFAHFKSGRSVTTNLNAYVFTKMHKKVVLQHSTIQEKRMVSMDQSGTFLSQLFNNVSQVIP